MTVRFLSAARRELGQAIVWLAPLAPDAAADLLARVKHAAALLDEGSVDGPSIALPSGKTLHRWPVPPLVLYYRRRGREVIVHRVRHMSQRPIAKP